MSSCTSATMPTYTIAISDSAIISIANSWLASGTMGSEKRRKPYTPIFSMIAASTTEPPVGASTSASGSQVSTGNIGTLTEKHQKNAARKSAGKGTRGEE